MRNWMAAKATYDRLMGVALCTWLDAIIPQNVVDPVTMPEVSHYPEQLTKPWEPKDPPYDEEMEDDNEEADE